MPPLSAGGGYDLNNAFADSASVLRGRQRRRLFQGLVIRHNLHGRDYPIAGSADNVTPGIRAQVILLRIDFEHGLIATALRAVDFFPRPQSFAVAEWLANLTRLYRGSRFESPSNGCSV
jgi:hypothetical protein